VHGILVKQETIIDIFVTSNEEYIVAAACCTQVLWMKWTLQDMQVKYDEPISILCDNTSTISV
jgi:hypothetical protein